MSFDVYLLYRRYAKEGLFFFILLIKQIVER